MDHARGAAALPARSTSISPFPGSTSAAARVRHARAQSDKDPKTLEATLNSLQQLGVTKLVTIAGDDTAFSAMRLSATRRRAQVVHVPKTIDNDLDLPAWIPTFGYRRRATSAPASCAIC